MTDIIMQATKICPECDGWSTCTGWCDKCRQKGIVTNSRAYRVQKNRETTGNDSMKVDWLTPPEILNALGPFELDPATTCTMAHDGKPWTTARIMHCRCTDGLNRPWFGRVWLNPPYERPLTERFVQKLAEHGDGIALVMARTESAWFQKYVFEMATGILFLRRRPHFYTEAGDRMKDRATTASALVAYGEYNLDSLAESKLEGKILLCATKGR